MGLVAGPADGTGGAYPALTGWIMKSAETPFILD